MPMRNHLFMVGSGITKLRYHQSVRAVVIPLTQFNLDVWETAHLPLP